MKKEYIVRIKDQLHMRKVILSMFTFVMNRPRIKTTGTTYADRSLRLQLLDIVILEHKKPIYAFVDAIDKSGYTFKLLEEVGDDLPPFNVIDKIKISTGDIANYTGPPMETTVGRFYINQTTLADVFGDAIPYINETVTPEDINKLLTEGFVSRKFTSEQFYKYIDRVFFVEQFSDICVPTETEKSMTTDPKMTKLKKELYEKYKGHFDDPVVVSKFEKELIDMDKKYLKGDPSERYFKMSEKKSYSIHRKKMYLTVGGIDGFSEKAGDMEFIYNSLADGWDPDKFDMVCNEVRKGAYSRGQETRKGGVQAKYLLRVFQDVLVTADDCKSKIGYPVTISEKLINDYIGRFMFTPKGLVELTKDNLSSLVGKEILIRSPMTCKTKDGFCKKCIGRELTKLDHDSIIAMVLSVSAMLLKMFLKNMHGTVLKTGTLDNWQSYLIEVKK